MKPNQLLLELEPLRSKLSNLKVISKNYEFTFFKSMPYRKGLLIISFVNENEKPIVASYAILKDKSKGEIRLNFNYKRMPLKIRKHKDINFKNLVDELKNL